jgi:sulfate transport system substrate-binding protein
MKLKNLFLTGLAAFGFASLASAQVSLLNVSYDPTRELYQEFNGAFAKHYKAETGKDVSIKQSHGGSGKQARAVIDGLDADVVTLALAYDVSALHDNGSLIPGNWQSRLPQNSAPYTSTIVFVVRKGNPKAIKDWDDLAKARREGDHAQSENLRRCALELSRRLGLRPGKGRGRSESPGIPRCALQKRARPRFRGARLHDDLRPAEYRRCLIAWENEAHLILKEFGADKYQIVNPSISILAEPTVSVVDKVVDKKGTRAVAEAYLKYLYSPEGQEIAAKNFYRPRNAEAAAKYAKNFEKIKLFTIDEKFGGWDKAQKKHFNDGGVFDKIYKP